MTNVARSTIVAELSRLSVRRPRQRRGSQRSDRRLVALWLRRHDRRAVHPMLGMLGVGHRCHLAPRVVCRSGRGSWIRCPMPVGTAWMMSGDMSGAEGSPARYHGGDLV